MDLVKSYLSDRKQFVPGNGSNTICLSVTFGVPQGSVLCHLLLLVCIIDLPLSSSELAFYLFADDLRYFIIHRMVNTELRKVKMWLDVNR